MIINVFSLLPLVVIQVEVPSYCRTVFVNYVVQAEMFLFLPFCMYGKESIQLKNKITLFPVYYYSRICSFCPLCLEWAFSL